MTTTARARGLLRTIGIGTTRPLTGLCLAARTVCLTISLALGGLGFTRSGGEEGIFAILGRQVPTATACGIHTATTLSVVTRARTLTSLGSCTITLRAFTTPA